MLVIGTSSALKKILLEVNSTDLTRFFVSFPLKGDSEILWSEVHFSPHILICLHIQKELSILTQHQQDFHRNNSFLTKQVDICIITISDAQASKIIQYSIHIQKYSSCYPACHRCKIKAKCNLNMSFYSEYLLIGAIEMGTQSQTSLNSPLIFKLRIKNTDINNK